MATLPLLACTHRPPCPGCPRFGEADLPTASLAALRTLAERCGVSLNVEHGASTGFRHRARLAIRGRAGSPKLGIFEEGSHRVVHIPNCVVHHPRVNEVANAVRRALVAERVPPYSDQAHAGVARYLQVAVERGSNRAQVVLVTNSEYTPALAPLFAAIERELGERLHSLWHNAQTERSNAILGPTFSRFAGSEALSERLGGAAVFFPPGAFGQNNLDLFERLVAEVHQGVPTGARVLELYAGVGAIGLGLLAKAEHITFNEIGTHSLRGLDLGLAALPEALARRASVAPGAAAECAGLVSEADVVIADPPRKGLDREILSALIARRPGRFVYVSCGLPAFLTQAAELLDGGFVLERLSAYGLFPFTEHVEVVASFVPATT